MARLSLNLLFSVLIFAVPTCLYAKIQVVASIKPIHSLVASVMTGLGKPTLIISGFSSPHTYALRPSQAELLSRADAVFWLGQELETFLKKPIETIATKAKSIELLRAPGLKTLPIRNVHALPNFSFYSKKSLKENALGTQDAHVWLDPKNAKAIVNTIVHVLSSIDQTNKSTYHSNGLYTLKRLDGLSIDIAAILAPVRNQKFVAFHDAFQYFERSYGLMTAGVVTISPEVIPGANRIKKIRAKIKASGVSCVFAEPQFSSKLVTTITNGTSAKTGIADPLGSNFNAGSDHYFLMMRKIAKIFHICLSRPHVSPSRL